MDLGGILEGSWRDLGGIFLSGADFVDVQLAGDDAPLSSEPMQHDAQQWCYKLF